MSISSNLFVTELFVQCHIHRNILPKEYLQLSFFGSYLINWRISSHLKNIPLSLVRNLRPITEPSKMCRKIVSSSSSFISKFIEEKIFHLKNLQFSKFGKLFAHYILFNFLQQVFCFHTKIIYFYSIQYFQDSRI